MARFGPIRVVNKYLQVDSASGERMTAPKMETRNAANLAYIEHFGPYDQIPWQDYIERLYGWAKERKVMPGFYPMGIYHDDPGAMPPEKCRSEIAITFKGRAKDSAGVKVRKLPAMKVASLSFHAPSSELRTSYAKLQEWIEKKGYTLSGAPIEVYSKKPDVVGGVTHLYAKIMFPVRKK